LVTCTSLVPSQETIIILTSHSQAQDQQNDSSYLCPVQIGTPAQTLMLDFDTGSSDLWVWSTELPKADLTSAGSHTVFNATKSSTYKKTSSTWEISYGDSSSASGNVGTDVVSIGGLKITGQAVELANTISAQFQQDTADGLLGLVSYFHLTNNCKC
jgi:Eukaryotic aspartyl protease